MNGEAAGGGPKDNVETMTHNIHEIQAEAAVVRFIMPT